MMKQKNAQLIAEAMTREIPRLWFEAHEGFNLDAAALAKEFREIRSFLVMTAMGYGIERTLYELNDSLHCQSPLIVDQYVFDAKSVLPAIELAAGSADPKTWPIDRHIAAFIACRYDRDLDPQMAALNDTTPERLAAGMLSLLAVLQFRFGPEAVPGVAAWCGGLVTPMVNSYHNREKRRVLGQDLMRMIHKGSLPELFAALDSPEERQKDRDSFAAAKQEYL
ncbi:MAG: protein kinase family protein, partial [Alphaproteobacteria bacterium]|nr:protein kinase family protein [Alphaproteobacteria bacterium]